VHPIPLLSLMTLLPAPPEPFARPLPPAEGASADLARGLLFAALARLLAERAAAPPPDGSC
jgi:hypothetical protein